MSGRCRRRNATLAQLVWPPWCSSFRSTGNQEISLDRKLVDRRIWPAIDINRSGTRREEMLLDPEEYRRVCVLRRVLNDMNPPEAMELLVGRLQKTQNNAEFLMSMNLK